jgi:hypothetical protein
MVVEVWAAFEETLRESELAAVAGLPERFVHVVGCGRRFGGD